MEYRYLGKTGMKVSPLCLGTMQFGWTADENTSIRILNASFDAGINFLDTADIYSNWAAENPGGIAEGIIGKWLVESKITRDQVVIATKVRGRMGIFPNDEGLSRKHILSAIEGSLRRLKTDYIDLYQTHWFDENTPIEETLRTFDDLIRAGKVRYTGASNIPAWRLIEAILSARIFNLEPYCSLQPHYNLVHRAEFERELADVCKKYSLAVLPYSPLAAGFLSGKYHPAKKVSSSRYDRASRYFSDQNWHLLDEMQKIARAKDCCSVSQVALAWLLSNPLIISPIIGPRNLDQLQDNLHAVEIELESNEIKLLDGITQWED